MRIEQLAYLLAISKSTSLNEASQKLHISHQCLNKSIKSLENELDTLLLLRNNKGVTLTEHGKKTLESAQAVLTIIENLKAQIQADNATPNSTALCGKLSIIATPLATNTTMPDCLKAYKRLHPQVKVTIIESAPETIISAVGSGAYQLGIANLMANNLDFEDPLSNCDYEILNSETGFVLVSKLSPLALYQSISFKTLLLHPLMLYSSDNSHTNWLLPFIETAGPLGNCTFTNNNNIYYESILNGTHATISNNSLYKSLDPLVQKQLVKIPLKNKLYGVTALVTLKNSILPPEVLAFIHLIKTYYAH